MRDCVIQKTGKKERYLKERTEYERVGTVGRQSQRKTDGKTNWKGGKTVRRHCRMNKNRKQDNEEDNNMTRKSREDS